VTKPGGWPERVALPRRGRGGARLGSACGPRWSPGQAGPADAPDRDMRCPRGSRIRGCARHRARPSVRCERPEPKRRQRGGDGFASDRSRRDLETLAQGAGQLRQYDSRRHVDIGRAGGIRQVGTVPVGAILLIHGRKVQVEAWLPRDCTAFVHGRFVLKRIAGGHVAQVRDLATGRAGGVSDAWPVDAGGIDTREPNGRALTRLKIDREARTQAPRRGVKNHVNRL